MVVYIMKLSHFRDNREVPKSSDAEAETAVSVPMDEKKQVRSEKA